MSATILLLLLSFQPVFLNTSIENIEKKAIYDLIPQYRMNNLESKTIQTKSKLRKTLKTIWQISDVNWTNKQGKIFFKKSLKEEC